MVTNRPLVTVLTVTYQNLDGLRRTYDSVRAQTLSASDFEFLVVDGGSTDGTVDLLESSTGVTWTSGPDDGIYDAMDRGTVQAAGEYILYLNGGDVFAKPTSLQSLVDALQTFQPLWLVCQAYDESADSVIGNLPHIWWRHAWGLQPHCHQATIFHRQTVIDIGGYDHNMDFVADFDLILRFGLLAKPVEVGEVLIRYEGAGVSRARADEIPHLIHSVRAARMNLSPTLIRTDRLLVQYQTLRRRFHRWKTRRGALR